MTARLEDGWNPDEVAKKDSKNRVTIYKIAKKPSKGKEIVMEKGSGRPHKLSGSDMSLIIKKLRKIVNSNHIRWP